MQSFLNPVESFAGVNQDEVDTILAEDFTYNRPQEDTQEAKEIGDFWEDDE